MTTRFLTSNSVSLLAHVVVAIFGSIANRSELRHEGYVVHSIDQTVALQVL